MLRTNAKKVAICSINDTDTDTERKTRKKKAREQRGNRNVTGGEDLNVDHEGAELTV